MKYILFLMMILFSGQAVALECVKQPSCADLGYKQENDPMCAHDGYLICPFDSNYKKCVNFSCESLGFTQSNKSTWCGKISKCPTDNTYTLCKALCEVGDVYYSDGTCGYVQDYDGTKTPVGVVFYVTDEGRHSKVVSLRSPLALNKHSYEPTSSVNLTLDHFPLGALDYTDTVTLITNEQLLTYYQTNNEVLFNGKKNTQDMLKGKVTDKKCLDGTYIENSREWEVYCQATSAILCLAYVPENVDSNNPIVGAGQWYMPSIGELMQLYGTDAAKMTEYSGNSGATGKTLEIVHQTMDGLQSKNINAEKFSGHYTFRRSSTRGGYGFYTLNMKTGARSSDFNQNSFNTRPMLEF